MPPPPHIPPATPFPSIGDIFTYRYEAVKGVFRYYITPSRSKFENGFFPFQSYKECFYDGGAYFNPLYGNHRTLEEANDCIASKRAEHEVREHHCRLRLSHNNLKGWTEAAAAIEARKRNSRKHPHHDNRSWQAIRAPHIGHARFMLEGTLTAGQGGTVTPRPLPVAAASSRSQAA